MKSTDIIKYPVSTEKVIRLMESENKLVFVIHTKAKKRDVKKAIEELFKGKVAKVNTLTLPDGKKRAYVKFAPETPAIDIATKLGIL